MAERKRRRLTNRMQDGCAYVQSETGKEGVGHYTTQRRLPELITFTCKVEDIMEKYGIESVEELDKKIDDFTNFMKGNKFETIEDLQNALNGKFIEVFDEKNKIWQDMVEKLVKTEKDRDTWHNACELACDVLRDINYKIYNEDRIDFENTFYQQAKKEGNDERN